MDSASRILQNADAPERMLAPSSVRQRGLDGTSVAVSTRSEHQPEPGVAVQQGRHVMGRPVLGTPFGGVVRRARDKTPHDARELRLDLDHLQRTESD